MNEFLKLTWRQTDERLTPCFLPEEMVSASYVYKSFSKPLKPNPNKKILKLHLQDVNFVPGKKYYRLISRRSLLTKTQKSHCLAALKLLQSGKKPEHMTAQQTFSLKVYSECQPKIVEENRLFLEHIQNIWNKHHDKSATCRPGIYNFAWPKWKDKLDVYFYYPQFYKEVTSLSLNFDESEATVDFCQVLNPLEMGSLARFNHPNLKEPCMLRLKKFDLISKPLQFNSKLPVSQDENITELIDKCDFDVVISSSGLKQFVDYTNTKAKWTIPVMVKQIVTGDKKNKKVVFVDKVLPKTNPTCHDLNLFAYKRLLKVQFCHYEAFSFPVKESPLYDGDKTDERKNDDSLGTNTNATSPNQNESKEKSEYHNVSYRIWSVKRTDNQNTLMKNKSKDQEIKLLVRTKLDSCEDTDDGVLYPVIVTPKIEQQLQYGVNISTKSELARDWTGLFFRIYSNLYRARIYNPTSEIIAIEKCSLQKINSEALAHYNYRPMLGLGVLQKILSALLELDAGNYLLQHLPKNGSFLSILKECDQGSHVYDLHAECNEAIVDGESRQNWLPIDLNYILPVHEEFGQIPGVFHGFDNMGTKNGDKKVLTGKKKGKKKKKKKKKNT